jgi:hypothetical protein
MGNLGGSGTKSSMLIEICVSVIVGVGVGISVIVGVSVGVCVNVGVGVGTNVSPSQYNSSSIGVISGSDTTFFLNLPQIPH